MSDLHALAGGTILTGFDGDTLDERADISRFAGCILFARNTPDLARTRSLTDAIRARFAFAPILAIDQEGGRIMRLQNGVEPMPPMMALGAIDDPSLAHDAGEQLGVDLRRAGCNLDFAPVLDLALDPRNTVIGTRSFGASPALVTRLGRAFAQGLSDASVIPVYKHFPGHGATAQDTHLEPARLDADRALLEARDLVPFAALAPGAPAMMAAHVSVPALDGDVPASISRAMLAGILRSSWRYDGVVFTDCMQMDAIARGVGTVEGVALAIAAGADCALVSHDLDLAHRAADHLAEQVADGTIPLERLLEAHARVIRLRALCAPPLALDAPPPHPGIAARIARRAIRVEAGSLPVPRDWPVVYSTRAHLDERERARVEAALDANERTVVVSIAEPYDLACFPRARTRIACYSGEPVVLQAVSDALYGD